MERVLTNAQMRASDEYTIKTLGISSEVLMERAGEALCDEVMLLLNEIGTAEILIVCGSGNNGGDGYVCARNLLKRGIAPLVYDVGGKYSKDCEREKERFTGEYATQIKGDIIVDCIFGTGLSREVTGDIANIIKQINASGAYVISADIPSGLNGDCGQVMGVAVRADQTVAIAEYKAGMFLGEGRAYCGKLVKKDIGITVTEEETASLYEASDISAFFPPRRQNSHKGTFGCADLVAGSRKYLGAALLSVGGAMRSGCGYVRLTMPKSRAFQSAICSNFPQTIVQRNIEWNAQAIVIGSGCGCTHTLYKTIGKLLKNYEGKLIIDADGLNALAKFGVGILSEKKCEVLLTPHIKEFSRLSEMSVGEIAKDPVECAGLFAAKYQVTVLLKSAVSVITDGVKVALNVTGNSALAKAGSGDMLAGFIGGSAARGLSLWNAAVCGAFVLGKAAEKCSQTTTQYCATAPEISNCIPAVIKDLTNG
jgi:NAD(P)H-hydrate epimerase